MQLRDKVELWGQTGESPGRDGMGVPLPAPVGILATSKAHVYYSSATLEFDSAYGRMTAGEKLRAIIPTPSFDVVAGQTWLVWQAVEYRIDGVLQRAGRGLLHHLTLDLSRRQ